MPQAPSPNMQIIWPTDGDDANAWAPIMDTAIRVTIDSHNHSPGGGAQVNISSLKFDADISFVDPGGGKHAIKNLLATAFFPSPASAMTGFAGAFFVSDGSGGLVNNELYFRSMLGTNIKVTDGGTLNVAAFTGGIGGDYVGVAALESFVDASDAYLFQQQVGGGVRQFAKMQCADLSLFEFKAVAAGPPVPTQSVTLKSPAALAAGYALTFPGALPASQVLAQVDATGAMTFSNSLAVNQSITVSGTGTYKHGTKTLSIHGALFQPMGSVNGTTNPNPGYDFSGAFPGVVANGAAPTTVLNVVAPVMLTIGDRILAVRFYVSDAAAGPTKVTCGIQSASGTTGSSSVSLGSAGPSAGNGTQQTLTISSLSLTVTSALCYFVTVQTTSGTSAAAVTMVEVDYDRP